MGRQIMVVPSVLSRALSAGTDGASTEDYVAEGLTGDEYRLPVWERPGIPMCAFFMHRFAKRFERFACQHHEDTFLLPACGRYAAEFGQFFTNLPDNVYVQARLAYALEDFE